MSLDRTTRIEKRIASIEKRLTEIRADILLIGTSPSIYVSGQYYGSTLSGGQMFANSKNVPADRIYAFPFPVLKPISIDRIATRVTVAQANSFLRMGIYDDNNGVPNNLLHGTAEFSCAATGVKEETIDIDLDAAFYWLAVFGDNDGANIQRLIAFDRGDNGHNGDYPGWIGYDSPFTTNVNPYLYYYKDQAYGPMPDPFPSSLTKHTYQTIHAILVRII